MSTEVKLKYCPGCRLNLDILLFGKNRSRADGVGYICKSCRPKRDHLSYLKHREKKLQTIRLYQTSGRRKKVRGDKDNAWHNAKRKELRKDPMVRLINAIRCGISGTLRRFGCRKNGVSWVKFVSFTEDQLKRHLEQLFQEGMSWDNYGGHTGWSVDHIVPITAFNFTSSEDDSFKKCWSLENLRPMWFPANRNKNNKLTKESKQLLSYWNSRES